MNIGDKVGADLVMEVVGIERDLFTNEILIKAKFKPDNYYSITLPATYFKLIEEAHVNVG